MRTVATIMVGLLLWAVPEHAAAQDEADEPVFADQRGWVWGVSAGETWLLAQAFTLAIDDDLCADDDFACLSLMTLAVAAASVSAGLAAEIHDTQPDVPFVEHHALWGAASGMVLGLGLADDDDDVMGVLGLTGIVVGAVGAGTYTGLRRDRLLRNPDGADGAAVITWGVPFTAILMAAITAAVSEDEFTTMLVTGLSAIAMYGLGIALAET